MGYSGSHGIFTEEEQKTTVPGREVGGGEERPNIIFLQLESFMDPTTIKGLSLSRILFLTFGS